jgi:hypothetical protein
VGGQTGERGIGHDAGEPVLVGTVGHVAVGHARVVDVPEQP